MSIQDNMKKIWILSMFIVSLIAFVACNDSLSSTTTDLATTSSSTTETTTDSSTTTLPTTTEGTTETTTENEEPAELAVSTSKPYIFVDVNVPLSLSDYTYHSNDGLLTAADGTYSNISDNLSIVGGDLTASEEGINTFDFTYGDESFTVYVFSKAASEDDYLVYERSFTNSPDGSIPEDFTIATVGSGSTGIKNGYLYVDSPDIADPTRVLLPDYLRGFKNYIIDVDFSILTAVEDTRWASVMYRYSTDNYFQMAIRQNATATNGVEFAKSVNGQWNVPLTTAFKERIDPAKIYHLTIDLKDANAKEYIDNELLVDYKNARDYSNGHIGVQSSGSRAIFNNFVVRVPASYIDNTTIEYQNIPTVYTPETNIIMGPTVIQAVKTQDDINQLNQEVRASTALFNMSASLNAVDDENQTLLEFNDILELVKNKTIPAFKVTLPFVAQNLAVKLGEFGVRDVFLVSSNGAAIERARSVYEMIRGVYQINYDSSKPVLSDIDLITICKETNTYGSSIVLLPVEYATHYNVSFIQKRLITVWVDSTDKSDVDIYQSIVSGAQGIVNDDTLNVYDIFGTFPENSMMRLPLIIGHRGFPSQAPENTVEGSWMAYQAGADVIELDIYLTTDNEIVVMHDSSTERTTDGNLIIENSTLAQLRELKIIDNFGAFSDIPVPTLEEYFARFKGEDVVLFIEIKSTNADIVPALKALVDEYDFYDQSVAITFHSAQATIMREVLPEISVGLLNSGLLNSENISSSVSATLNQIVPLKTTLNPYYQPITQEMLAELQHRGITVWPWTINNPTDFINQILLGVNGITTDYSDWISQEIIEFKVSNKEYTYSISNPTTVELMGRFGNRAGLDYPFPYQFVILSGEDTGVTFGTRNSVTSATSSGDVYVLPFFETTLSDGTVIRLFDDIVHINILD
jgi:glycerophosphoryl diester phosphodiesterase